MAPRNPRFAITVFIVIIAALTLSACAPAAPAPAAAPTSAPAAAAQPFKIGLVHPSPITDSWSGFAWAGLKRAESELGAQIAKPCATSPPTGWPLSSSRTS